MRIEDGSVFIGRKQVRKDGAGQLAIAPPDSAWRHTVPSTQFRWVDAKQAGVLRRNRIVFDTNHSVDEMIVFRVVSFSPDITLKHFRTWAKRGGFDEESLSFKHISITTAANSGGLLIIPLPQD